MAYIDVVRGDIGERIEIEVYHDLIGLLSSDKDVSFKSLWERVETIRDRLEDEILTNAEASILDTRIYNDHMDYYIDVAVTRIDEASMSVYVAVSSDGGGILGEQLVQVFNDLCVEYLYASLDRLVAFVNHKLL